MINGVRPASEVVGQLVRDPAGALQRLAGTAL